MPTTQPRIRILHVTFNMGYGGTEQVIRQLVNNLDPEAFECEIACIDGEIGAIGQSMQSDRGIPIHARKRGPGLDWATIRWLRTLIKSGQFSIVHCHQYSPYTYGWFAHWGTGAKLVFTEHGRFHPDRYRWKAALINPIMAMTTHRVIAIAEATRRALSRYEFMPKFKIQVIYNGISGLNRNADRTQNLKQSLGIPDNHFIMGSVARLDSIKNQALMIRATKVLADHGHPIILLLVGDGPERNSLEIMTNDLGMQDHVIFTGFQMEPADYLSLMDLFLLTSFSEGTSMTLLEAMSLGVPTVVTDVGGNPEIVKHGVTGSVIPDDNLPGLVAAVKSHLEDTQETLTMSAAAYEHFQLTFSAPTMAEAYQRLYQ